LTQSSSIYEIVNLVGNLYLFMIDNSEETQHEQEMLAVLTLMSMLKRKREAAIRQSTNVSMISVDNEDFKRKKESHSSARVVRIHTSGMPVRTCIQIYCGAVIIRIIGRFGLLQ